MAFVFFSVVVSGLIVMKHKGYIERLWNGTESKIEPCCPHGEGVKKRSGGWCS